MHQLRDVVDALDVQRFDEVRHRGEDFLDVAERFLEVVEARIVGVAIGADVGKIFSGSTSFAALLDESPSTFPRSWACAAETSVSMLMVLR